MDRFINQKVIDKNESDKETNNLVTQLQNDNATLKANVINNQNAILALMMAGLPPM